MSNGFDMCDNHTYLFATEGKDCPYCEIDRLKAELESKDKAIKLLQGHCNALMDTEGKLAQWKKGHTAGQEAAGYYQKQADDMIRQLMKELSDENANFTEEIMNLEHHLAEVKHELETTQLHLMEEETTRKIWEQDCKKAESQLAEVRAELARIGSVLGLQEYTKHIRQEAASEIVNTLFNTEFEGPNKAKFEKVTAAFISHIKSKFGLEG